MMKRKRVNITMEKISTYDIDKLSLKQEDKQRFKSYKKKYDGLNGLLDIMFFLYIITMGVNHFVTNAAMILLIVSLLGIAVCVYICVSTQQLNRKLEKLVQPYYPKEAVKVGGMLVNMHNMVLVLMVITMIMNIIQFMIQ